MMLTPDTYPPFQTPERHQGLRPDREHHGVLPDGRDPARAPGPLRGAQLRHLGLLRLLHRAVRFGLVCLFLGVGVLPFVGVGGKMVGGIWPCMPP